MRKFVPQTIAVKSETETVEMPRKSAIDHLFESFEVAANIGYFLTSEEYEAIKPHDKFINIDGVEFANLPRFKDGSEGKRWGKIYVTGGRRCEMKVKNSVLTRYEMLEPAYDRGFDRNSPHYNPALEDEQNARFDIEYTDEFEEIEVG